MDSNDLDKTQQKSEPEPPRQLRDLPDVVSEEDAKLIKGGPQGPPYKPNART